MCDLTNPIYNDENKAREHLEAIRWPDGAYCPYCASQSKVKRLGGKSMGPGWYHCGDCRKKFTVRVGTVYERSKVSLGKWILATHLLAASKKGMSAHQLHRMLGVTYKTAWFMCHRIREAMKDDNPGPMGGGGKSVEADETYFGKTDLAKRLNKQFPDRKKRRGLDKLKVMALVERDGEIRSFKVDRVNSSTVQDVLFRNVDRKSDLLTDEANYYKASGEEYASHKTVNHGRKEYARGFGIHVNTLEGYFGLFKRGMKGVYQHCGEKHLQRYLCEFDFRYNNRDITDAERRDKALQGIEGKRLTYRRTGNGAYQQT